VLALKSVFFALLVPGTVTILVPYGLASREIAASLAQWGARQSLALLPMVLGAAILARCIWDFATLGRGTLAPIDPPTHLVVRGLYRYVRNPMYVGALLLLLGEAWAFQSVSILAWTLTWFVFINAIVLFYEEPVLTRRFGESYERYRRSVGRWIPGSPYRE
jgi:protein-S-isoprenylcysteine O-methyltransferase Ste14